ncbi:MAG: neutral/alkaline non-lysosomal ceramidase N-terminal domain-containing protein [Alphaproteobacteria bacterium]
MLQAGTHTHSGCANFDRRYVSRKFFGDYRQEVFDRIVAQFTAALIEARQNMRMARIEYAAAEIENMNRSRRDPAFSVDISAVQEGAEPDPVKYPVNKRLAVVRISDLEETPLAVLVNFASHPTILSPKNLQVSADWPGAMARYVRAELGGDAPVLFFNGSLGDAAPTPEWADDVAIEIVQMQIYGQMMAYHVMKLLPQVRPMSKHVVGGFTHRREFSRAVLRFFHGLRLPRFISKIAFLRPDAPFQAMRLGDIVLLNIPGEPTTAVGKKLEAMCDEDTLGLTIAPANGYLGYFVTPEEYEEGGYAADSCLWGEDTGLRVIEAAGVALRNLEGNREF